MKSFSFYFFVFIYCHVQMTLALGAATHNFCQSCRVTFAHALKLILFALLHTHASSSDALIWLHDTNDTCCRLARPPDLARAATVVCVIGTLSSTRCCSRVQFFTSATTPASVNGEKRGRKGKKKGGKKKSGLYE